MRPYDGQRHAGHAGLPCVSSVQPDRIISILFCSQDTALQMQRANVKPQHLRFSCSLFHAFSPGCCMPVQAVKAAAKAHQDVSGGGIYVGLGGVALTYLRIVQQVMIRN